MGACSHSCWSHLPRNSCNDRGNPLKLLWFAHTLFMILFRTFHTFSQRAVFLLFGFRKSWVSTQTVLDHHCLETAAVTSLKIRKT